MKPTIRLARLDDAEAISHLQVRAWQSAYRGILPDAMLDAMDPDKNARKRRARMEDPVSPELRDWLLEEGGRLVGWAAAGPARDEDLGQDVHELYAIYLEPDCVGRGYGRKLMQHCLDDAVERGFGEMVMWVLTGNERAQRFYAAAGFDRDARVEATPFRDTGAHKLRMVRSLIEP